MVEIDKLGKDFFLEKLKGRKVEGCRKYPLLSGRKRIWQDIRFLLLFDAFSLLRFWDYLFCFLGYKTNPRIPIEIILGD